MQKALKIIAFCEFQWGCNRAIPRIWATQKMAIFKGKSIAYEAHIETALDWE
jgi:hypothetical protein